MIEYVLYTSIFDSILYPIVKPTWLYRVIQKILEGIGLYIVYIFLGFDGVAGCLICHYFLVQDRLFYLFRNEEDIINTYEYTRGKARPFWLVRIYYSGAWLFKDYFSMHRFDYSAFIGLLTGYLIIKFKIITFLIGSFL